MIKRLFKDPLDWITSIGVIFVLIDEIVGIVAKGLFNSTAVSAIGVGLMIVHGIGTAFLLKEYTKGNY